MRGSAIKIIVHNFLHGFWIPDQILPSACYAQSSTSMKIINPQKSPSHFRSCGKNCPWIWTLNTLNPLYPLNPFPPPFWGGQIIKLLVTGTSCGFSGTVCGIMLHSKVLPIGAINAGNGLEFMRQLDGSIFKNHQNPRIWPTQNGRVGVQSVN